MQAYTLATAGGKVLSFGVSDVDGVGSDLVFLVFSSRDKAMEMEERLRGNGLHLELEVDAPPLAVMGVELRGGEGII